MDYWYSLLHWPQNEAHPKIKHRLTKGTLTIIDTGWLDHHFIADNRQMAWVWDSRMDTHWPFLNFYVQLPHLLQYGCDRKGNEGDHLENTAKSWLNAWIGQASKIQSFRRDELPHSIFYLRNGLLHSDEFAGGCNHSLRREIFSYSAGNHGQFLQYSLLFFQEMALRQIQRGISWKIHALLSWIWRFC